MQRANVNGAVLEYEVKGSGEPVLLIGTGPIADSFLPFASGKVLTDDYRLIRYHQRGQVGSTRSAQPVSFAQHAADAAALLDYLGVRRAHVAGHSTGGVIAIQLAADFPEVVHSLALLEPMLFGVPCAGEFFESAAPVLAAYSAGDRDGAMAMLLSGVSGLDVDTSQAVIEKHVPGGVAQAKKDADTFFAGFLPALQAWQFGRAEAAAFAGPVLSVLGTETDQLFVEGRELLGSWFPQTEECTIEGIGHLLHMQRADAVVEGVRGFLERHAITVNEPAVPR